MVWSLALCPDDARQDPVVYGEEFGVVFLTKGPRTPSLQEGLNCLGLYHSCLEGKRCVVTIPDLRFLLCVPENVYGYIKYYKMGLNVCVNEMAPFGPFAAVLFLRANWPLTAMARKNNCLRDERGDPRGTKVFPIERHGVC